MTICFVNNQEFNSRIGGIESVSVTLAKEFINNGHKVIFLALVRSSFSEEYSLPAVQLFFPQTHSIDSDENSCFLYNIIEVHNIDVVINQSSNFPALNSLCYRITRERNAKLVSVLHFNPDYLTTYLSESLKNNIGRALSLKQWGLSLIKYFYYKLYKLRKLDKLQSQSYLNILLQSDSFVLLSEKYINSVSKRINLLDENKLHYINNAIELSDKDDKHIDRESIILYVGRLSKAQKRPDRLIKIWRKISPLYPNWKLVIAGDGEYRSHLEKMIARNGVERVEFVGFQNPQDYYLRSKIVCMTSSFEGFPMVLIEAQQYGCVPIAYNSFGALSDIVEDGVNGFRIKPFSRKEYIKRLHQLMDNDNLREQMSNAGKESVKKLDVKIITKQWIELFEKLMQNEQ